MRSTLWTRSLLMGEELIQVRLGDPRGTEGDLHVWMTRHLLLFLLFAIFAYFCMPSQVVNSRKVERVVVSG